MKVESVAKITNSLNLMRSFQTLMQVASAVFAVRVLIATRAFTTVVASQTMNVITTVVQSVWTMLQRLEKIKSQKSNKFIVIYCKNFWITEIKKS